MRRMLLLGAVVAAGLGGLAGCPSEQRTVRTAQELGRDPVVGGGAVLSSMEKPVKSDPAATALVTAAVAAHTGGKPDLLGKLKAVVTTQTVVIGSNGERQPWLLHAAWPEKYRLRADVSSVNQVIMARSGPRAWALPTPFKPSDAEDFKLDTSGEWYRWLLPLVQPDTVVAPVPDLTVNGRPAAGVRVWAAGVTAGAVYFDKETHRMSQYSYDGREGDAKVVKDVAVLSDRAYDGITLPERTVTRVAGRQLAEVVVTAVELPGTIDPKVFEEP